jgi:hypothetical protein
MAGITKDPEIEHKIKRMTDHVFHHMCKNYKSPSLQAGFEMFRNGMIMHLKHEKLNFEDGVL